jgi:hypothetical protein
MTLLIRGLHWIRSSALGRRDPSVTSAWQVIGWWEARRIPFNLIVGATGTVTSGLVLATALISERLIGEPIGWPDPPIVIILAVIAFAGGANVCYTGGWLAELIVRRAWPDESRSFGTVAFTLGVPFAVVVTVLPAVLIAGLAIVAVLARRLGYEL